MDKQSRHVLIELLKFTRPHLKLFLIAGLMIPVSAGLQLAQPYIIKITIDNYIANAAIQGIVMMSCIYLASFVLEGLSDCLHTIFMTLAAQSSLYDIRMRLLRHLQSVPVAYFDDYPAGTAVSRVANDVDVINELFVQGLMAMIKDLILIIAIVGVLFYMHWRLALFSLSLLPILWITINIIQRSLRKSYALMRKIVGRMSSHISESVAGISVIKLFQREQINAKEFDDFSKQYMKEALRNNINDSILYSLVELTSTITVSIILWYGSRKIGLNAIGGSDLSIGLLVAFIEYLNRLFTPLRDLSGKLSILQSAIASGYRIVEVLDVEVEDAKSTGNTDNNISDSDDLGIVVEDIHFAYRDELKVINGVSFEVPEKKRVAIIGATGSGKTTIARLLTKLYPLNQGTISLVQAEKRVAIADLSPTKLRQLIGMIPQEAVIFRGTVAENICLQIEPSDQSLKRVGEILNTLELASWFELDDFCEERGQNLSAGERQLIGFARLLYYDPKFIIFDEATSNVDLVMEKKLQEVAKHILKDRGALIIAHRLSTIIAADNILIMQKGKLHSSGTHDELLKTSTIYQKLIAHYSGKSLTAAAVPAD